MSGLGYIWEKLYVAAETLSTGSGTIQERLLDATVSALMRLEPEDFGEAYRERFAELMSALSGLEGSILSMTVEEARHHASEVFDLFCLAASQSEAAGDGPIAADAD